MKQTLVSVRPVTRPVRPRPPLRVRPSALRTALERTIEILDAAPLHLVARPESPLL